MRQSLNIIEQALNLLPEGTIKSGGPKYTPSNRSEMKLSMEAVIHHFKLHSEGLIVPAETYTAMKLLKVNLVFILFLIIRINLLDVK